MVVSSEIAVEKVEKKPVVDDAAQKAEAEEKQAETAAVNSAEGKTSDNKGKKRGLGKKNKTASSNTSQHQADTSTSKAKVPSKGVRQKDKSSIAKKEVAISSSTKKQIGAPSTSLASTAVHKSQHEVTAEQLVAASQELTSKIAEKRKKTGNLNEGINIADGDKKTQHAAKTLLAAAVKGNPDLDQTYLPNPADPWSPELDGKLLAQANRRLSIGGNPEEFQLGTVVGLLGSANVKAEQGQMLAQVDGGDITGANNTLPADTSNNATRKTYDERPPTQAEVSKTLQSYAQYSQRKTESSYP